jgi:hypothetical protein
MESVTFIGTRTSYVTVGGLHWTRSPRRSGWRTSCGTGEGLRTIIFMSYVGWMGCSNNLLGMIPKEEWMAYLMWYR